MANVGPDRSAKLLSGKISSKTSFTNKLLFSSIPFVQITKGLSFFWYFFKFTKHSLKNFDGVVTKIISLSFKSFISLVALIPGLSLMPERK